MKRALLLSVAFALAVPPGAGADELYIKLNYARTFQDATVTDTAGQLQAVAEVDIASGNLFGAAFGAALPLSPKWGQFEWEAELAYRDAPTNGATISGAVPNAFIDGADLDSVTTTTLLGNIWWRPKIWGQIRPYIGAGAGGAYLPSGGLSQDDIYALAYQFGGGVDYEFRNGIRAGVGYRRLTINANDVDDDDPLFIFETDSDLNENALYATATLPFSAFGRGGSSRRVARGPQNLTPADKASETAIRTEAARRRALQKQAKQEAKARKAREKEAERQARAAEKTRKKAEDKGLFAKLNPFSSKPQIRDGSEKDFKSINVARVDARSATPATPRRAPSVAPRSAKPKAETYAAKATPAATRTLRQPQNVQQKRSTPIATASAGATMPTSVSLRTVEQRPAVTRTASATPSAAKSNARYFAQLGAYSSESFAREMWTAKSGRQPAVFSNAKYVVRPYKSSGSGKMLYLLQIGPYDRVDAKAMCAMVNGECIVVGG
ncbi:MAG: outer membrane beta-barrel protein [Pseudomonadota bacterium]